MNFREYLNEGKKLDLDKVAKEFGYKNLSDFERDIDFTPKHVQIGKDSDGDGVYLIWDTEYEKTKGEDGVIAVFDLEGNEAEADNGPYGKIF